MAKNSNTLTDKFASILFKLNSINFFGVAYLLGFDLTQIAATPEEERIDKMNQLVADTLNKFETLNREKKKEIIKLCQQTLKEQNRKGDSNGNRSETESD